MFAPPDRPDPAFLPRESWQGLQAERLIRHVAVAATRSPHYRRVFAEAEVDPESIRTPADLIRLPFTAKTDLERDGETFFAAPESDMVDLCLTSGTTADPIAFPQTRSDLERLAENEERAFRTVGVAATDRVVVAAALDRCFMAGAAYWLGLVRLGALVIRAGSSSIAVLSDLVVKRKPTVMVGVPTLFNVLAERLDAAGIDPAALGVKKLVCIGEPVRNQDFSPSALGKRLVDAFGARIYGTYASTELASTFCECREGRGGHLIPDLCVLELVDDSGKPVPPGTPGEVVATPLGVTGTPLIRWRTGDVAILHEEPCACGRTTPRLGPILGRKNQALKFKGSLLYPQAVFAALQALPGVVGYYLEASTSFELSDHVRVVAAVSDESLTTERIAERIAQAVRVKPEVVLASAEAVRLKTQPEDKRKPVLFFDHRET